MMCFAITHLFDSFLVCRYLLSVEVIGCAYMLLQIPFAAISVASGNKIGGSKLVPQLLIFTDIVSIELEEFFFSFSVRR